MEEQEEGGYPWRAFIICFNEDIDGYSTAFANAYHLEDLVVDVQTTINRGGLFRVLLPIGNREVSAETWADMLSREYWTGHPERTWREATVAIRNGAVVIRCE